MYTTHHHFSELGSIHVSPNLILTIKVEQSTQNLSLNPIQSRFGDSSSKLEIFLVSQCKTSKSVVYRKTDVVHDDCSDRL